MAKKQALWLLLSIASLSTILLVTTLKGYGGIALSIWVPCPVPVELNVYLPASNLVVPLLVAARGIHCSTYVVSHVVGHNAPGLLLANGVPSPPDGPFLYTKHFGEIVLDFWMF